MSVLFYAPAQLAVAKESFEFWTSKHLPYDSVIGLMANESGETSFNFKDVGDHDQAFGSFQWHADRIEEIKRGCGINVQSASHVQQLQGAYYEMTRGWYKKVWPLLMSATNLVQAVTIGVEDYEQSAAQTSDIIKRGVIAGYLATVFPQA